MDDKVREYRRCRQRERVNRRAVSMSLLTIEEYLEIENRAEVRHDFVAGRIYAMSGATKRHNVIAGNIFVELRRAARGGPCRVYVSDVRLPRGWT